MRNRRAFNLNFLFVIALKRMILLLLFLTEIMSLKAEEPNDYYKLVDSAEQNIIQNKYFESIKLYNRAFQLRRLSDISYKNYVEILKTSEDLLLKYFDTLRHFDSVYDINKINLYFKDSSHFNLLHSKKVNKCEAFIHKFRSMAMMIKKYEIKR
jgi:hypothetical protein